MDRKRIFLNHKKSSALMVSVIIHAVFIVVALSFVAVTVIQKDDTFFEAKPVKRPKMKLRKLQVPVKQSKKKPVPKLRKTIVAKPRTPDVNIKMPEIAGIKGGTSYGSGTGLAGLGFNFDLDLFGSNSKGAGNDFVGHFYDLKQTRKGQPSEIGQLLAQANGDWNDPNYGASRKAYREVVTHFLKTWDDGRLKDYFMAQREKFSTTFMIPLIDAEEAPKAFGVENQVKPMEWIALYRGQIVAPESGKYRFVGRGDDVLVVRVKKRVVIDASWVKMTEWESNDPDNGKYRNYNEGKGCVIGDWFHLQKGNAVPMEVLIGEEPGGHFFCQLYIQKEGEQYPVTTESYAGESPGTTETLQRPIFPVFKTAPVHDNIAAQMEINSDWATLDGPVFGTEQTR